MLINDNSEFQHLGAIFHADECSSHLKVFNIS